jgi:hypothetical protein
VWLKTRNTHTEQVLDSHKKMVELLKQNRIDIPANCKDIYERIKQILTTDSEYDPCVKLEATLCAYIYNKNRAKSFQTFEKYKREAQENLDECLFEGKERTIVLQTTGGTKTELTGDESVRVDAILVKLTVERYTLMLAQTFP